MRCWSSINAEHRPRRLAALVLVEVLRSGRDLGTSGGLRETIPPEDVMRVADETKALIAKYRLGGADAPLHHPSPSVRDGIA